MISPIRWEFGSAAVMRSSSAAVLTGISGFLSAWANTSRKSFNGGSDMGGQLANYGRHSVELARGSRQPKDTKERRMIAIDRASRAHKTVPARWRQHVK